MDRQPLPSNYTGIFGNLPISLATLLGCFLILYILFFRTLRQFQQDQRPSRVRQLCERIEQVQRRIDDLLQLTREDVQVTWEEISALVNILTIDVRRLNDEVISFTNVSTSYHRLVGETRTMNPIHRQPPHNGLCNRIGPRQSNRMQVDSSIWTNSNDLGGVALLNGESGSGSRASIQRPTVRWAPYTIDEESRNKTERGGKITTPETPDYAPELTGNDRPFDATFPRGSTSYAERMRTLGVLEQDNQVFEQLRQHKSRSSDDSIVHPPSQPIANDDASSPQVAATAQASRFVWLNLFRRLDGVSGTAAHRQARRWLILQEFRENVLGMQNSDESEEWQRTRESIMRHYEEVDADSNSHQERKETSRIDRSEEQGYDRNGSIGADPVQA